MSGKKVNLNRAFREAEKRQQPQLEPEAPKAKSEGTDESTSTTQKYDPPSRRDKRHISGFYEESIWVQLKILGLEKNLTIQEMLGEALNCYFIANDKPALYKKEE